MISRTTPEIKAESRRLLDAIEAERQRQQVLMTAMSGKTEYCPMTYYNAQRRGTVLLTTLIAFCDQLDIDIVLVNRDGEAIT